MHSIENSKHKHMQDTHTHTKQNKTKNQGETNCIPATSINFVSLYLCTFHRWWPEKNGGKMKRAGQGLDGPQHAAICQRGGGQTEMEKTVGHVHHPSWPPYDPATGHGVRWGEVRIRYPLPVKVPEEVQSGGEILDQPLIISFLLLIEMPIGAT